MSKQTSYSPVASSVDKDKNEKLEVRIVKPADCREPEAEQRQQPR
jgi:hypothetical protein